MSGCCDPDYYQSVFSGRFARRQSKRYRRRGLTPAARGIVDFATSRGIARATVLEIGGGVGQIQVELLRRGASHVTNLEISQNYEAEAARLLAEAGMTDRVTRRFLDIAQALDEVQPADVVVLHRVVCCYPDTPGCCRWPPATPARHWSTAIPQPTSSTVCSSAPRTSTAGSAAMTSERSSTPPQGMIRAVESDGLAVAYRHHAWDWDVVGLAR